MDRLMDTVNEIKQLQEEFEYHLKIEQEAERLICEGKYQEAVSLLHTTRESVNINGQDKDAAENLDSSATERGENEPVRTSFFTAYEVASPIIHDWENYVVIHRTFQEEREAIADEVLYNPSEKKFMFVNTGDDLYQEYNDFSLVKKFLTELEIKKFNEVMLKTEAGMVEPVSEALDDMKESGNKDSVPESDTESGQRRSRKVHRR